MDARAGRSNDRKYPSAMANEAGTRGRHGEWQEKRAKNGGRRDREGAESLGVQGNFGGREASGVDPEIHGVGGGGGGLQGLRSGGKPGGGRHGVGGGVQSFQDNSTPNGLGGGVESFQDDLTPNGVGGGVELSQDD